MKKEDLENWYNLREQVMNGQYMSENDKRELIRLNHLVMEETHKIHNARMLEK